jgi:hypothetical protein
VEFLAWPGVVLVLGIICVLLFKRPIERFLDRAKSIGPAGLQAHDATVQVRQSTPHISDLLKQFDSPILVNLEANARKNLDDLNLSADDRERLLLRHLAQAWMIQAFERVYRTIWGSQLLILEMLNAKGDAGQSTEWARAFFEEGATKEPEMYKDYPFEDWLNYVVGAQMISREVDRIRITIDGREFLKYVISQGYSVVKIG